MSNAQDDTEQQVCLQCRKNAPLLGVHVKNEMRRKHEIATIITIEIFNETFEGII